MRFAASMHQTKAHPFVHALLRHGHEMVRTGGDVFLLDLDTTPNRQMIDHHAANGSKVFLYPHGPITQTLYDMGFAPDPRVVAHFVPGEGQRELLRRIGVDVPVYTVGWPWSELAPFRATDNPRRVLFAPFHPLDHDGSMPEFQRAANRRIYDQLLELDVELTVRHYMDIEHNGLYPVDGVKYSPSKLDTSTDDIDAADVVLAVGTFAGLSIARGAPTIMFDQAETPYHIKLDGTLVHPEKWDDYKDLVRYPFDIADGPLDELIRTAARSDEPIREWRELFVGGPFDETAFCTLLDKLRRDPVVESELRERVVVAFADELVERPELLTRYSEFAGPNDPVTLVVYAPDRDAETVVEPLQGALAAARLDESNMPDLLLSAIERNEVYERAIARRASALLSDREVTGPLAGLPRDLNIEAIPAAGSDAALPHA
jgi:hypothetical protein